MPIKKARKGDGGKTPGPPKRIFLVDDPPAFREGIKAILKITHVMEVCGEASNAREAIDAILKVQPDLVLTDISMPGRSGLELVKDLKVVIPRIRILVMSMHEDTVYSLRVIQAGGHGFLSKESTSDEIVDALQRIFEGQMVFRHDHLLQRPRNLPGRDASGTVAGIGFLTDREMEVFELLGHGKSTRDIGEQLSISVKTVEVHRTNIRHKLNIKNAAELSHAAYRWVYQGGNARREEEGESPRSLF